MTRTHLRHITVDLTPMEPGGTNGGAKLLALSLVRELACLLPTTHFTLLTSRRIHAELAELDSAHIYRQLVDADAVPTVEHTPNLARARRVARVLVDTLVPGPARARIKDAVWRQVKRRRRRDVAHRIDQPADLHVCPFTAPFFFDADVPLVSIVHDLQFLDLPENFDERQRRERKTHFLDACARADRLICVSEFVRQSVLQHSARSPETVTTVHSALVHASAPHAASTMSPRDLLARAGMTAERYLFYPANAWPHKNHARLLEGFARFLHTHPHTDLGLVCSGAPSDAFERWSDLAGEILPAGRFGFVGYVPESEYSSLLNNCRALVFPSLYEGFGLPLLEAMACGRPVLCSEATSLPEVAGDAAILFDARNPVAIADAIQQLESEPDLEARLVALGRHRAAQFGSGRDMAARYLSVLEDVAAARQRAHRP